MYKVCLVEDDSDLRVLLADWLQGCRRLSLLAAWGSGEEALSELPKLRPDVLLMDIKLPGISGIDCLVALRHLDPPVDCPVVMLTEYDDGELILRALEGGADGYLLKRHASTRQLEIAIAQVMAGGGPMSPSVAHKVIGSFHAHQVIRGDGLNQLELSMLSLTSREREVVNLVAQGLQYKEIADQLDISLHTVRTHLRSLYFKLRVHSRCDPRIYSASRGLHGSSAALFNCTSPKMR